MAMQCDYQFVLCPYLCCKGSKPDITSRKTHLYNLDMQNRL